MSTSTYEADQNIKHLIKTSFVNAFDYDDDKEPEELSNYFERNWNQVLLFPENCASPSDKFVKPHLRNWKPTVDDGLTFSHPSLQSDYACISENGKTASSTEEAAKADDVHSLDDLHIAELFECDQIVNSNTASLTDASTCTSFHSLSTKHDEVSHMEPEAVNYSTNLTVPMQNLSSQLADAMKCYQSLLTRMNAQSFMLQQCIQQISLLSMNIRHRTGINRIHNMNHMGGFMFSRLPIFPPVSSRGFPPCYSRGLI